jgi:hypothetical protein
MRLPDKTKLEKLIAKIDSGKAVSLRDIQFNLGINGLNKYNRLWAAEQASRKFFEVKPTQIQDYDALVKEADFANNKHQPNTKHPKPTKHYQLCIDLHKTIVEADITLAQWFDRHINEVTADVFGVARLVTSRSELKRTGTEVINKETIKRKLLTEAVDKIEAEQKAFSESDHGKKLKLMLTGLKGKSRL